MEGLGLAAKRLSVVPKLRRPKCGGTVGRCNAFWLIYSRGNERTKSKIAKKKGEWERIPQSYRLQSFVWVLIRNIIQTTAQSLHQIAIGTKFALPDVNWQAGIRRGPALLPMTIYCKESAGF